MKMLLRYALFMLCVMAITGCDTAAGAPRKATVAMREPVTLDMHRDVTMETGFISLHCFQRLMEYDSKGKLVPGLLSAPPVVSEDGLTYSFTLRSGQVFSDGSPLTSEDVKYSVERILKPESEGWNTWIFDSVRGAVAVMEGTEGVLSGFRVIDDWHFEIVLTKKYGPFIMGLASPYAAIMNSDIRLSPEDGWVDVPVGSGAYKPVLWEDGKRMILTKNPHYSGAAFKVDTIEVVFFDRFSEMLAGYERDAIDILSVPPEEMAGIQANIGVKDELETIRALNIHYLLLNNGNTYLKDVRVRKAISLAIDREALCTKVLKGAAVPAYSFMPPGVIGHNPDARIPYDPAEARRLIVAAGYPDGFDLDYPCVQIIETDYALKSMLEQVGIRLNIRQIDAQSRKELRATGKLTAILSYWWADIPDGDNFLYNKFHSSQPHASQYDNREFNRLCDSGRSESDLQKRDRLYKAADALLCREDWATVPISYNLESLLKKPWLGEAYLHPVNSIPVLGGNGVQ